MHEGILASVEKGLEDVYRRVLVPLDGSKAAEMALPYAEEVAAGLRSQLVILGVSPPGRERLCQIYLEDTAERIRRQLKSWTLERAAVVTSEVLSGEPAIEILRYCEAKQVGLIVMTSRGASVRGPWLFGNVAAKVLRATTLPVLLIRAPASETVIQQKRLIKKILVPLDGSELGAAAIPFGEALGGALDAEVVLFHAVQPAPILATVEAGAPYSRPMADARTTAFAEGYLNDLCELLQERGLKASSLVTLGYAPEQIIDYAKTHAVGLIAMSSHGRTGISRWVFGSVTDKVLYAGDTPVLVVRATKV